MQILLILLVVFFGSLQAEPPAYNSYSSNLHLGQALEFEGKAIRFREILSDSRCPKGVTCVWAGEAKVLVEMFEGGKSCGEQVLTLGGNSELLSLQHLFSGEIISLLPAVLAPYPEINKEIKPGDYSLHLQVRVKSE